MAYAQIWILKHGTWIRICWQTKNKGISIDWLKVCPLIDSKPVYKIRKIFAGSYY